MSFSTIRRFVNRQSTFADIPKSADGNNGLTNIVPFSTAETSFHGSLDESEVFPVAEPYIYSTLERNEIRIFWMQMSDGTEDEITGILETVTLDRAFLATNDKQYTSLSYAWGPTSEDGSHLTDAIICHGRRLKVTSNLNHALKRIRAHTSAELMRRQTARRGHQFNGMKALWIDAICINQGDLQERSAQVQNMGKIFAESKTLIIWLGEPDNGKLGAAQCKLIRHLWAVRHLPPVSGRAIDSIAFGEENLRVVLHSILARPWFSRRWVIQESAPWGVAGYIWLGSTYCRRDQFESLLKRQNLMTLAKPLHDTATDQSIFRTLYTYDDSECEDARDRVFAVKDLSWHGAWIQVDYNQDIRATYLNLVRSIIFRMTERQDFAAQFLGGQAQNRSTPLESEAFEVLVLASCKKKDPRQSPVHAMESWYPDWTVQTQFESNEHQQAVEIVMRDAIDALSLPLVLGTHKLIVARNGYHYYGVAGLLVNADATICETPKPFVEVEPEYRLRLHAWAESIYYQSKTYCAGKDAELNRVWLTMFAWSGAEHVIRPRILAFVLRPGHSQPKFQDMPVYRVESCFMVTAPPVESNVSSTEWAGTAHDWSPISPWKQSLKSTPFLSWTEFCLE